MVLAVAVMVKVEIMLETLELLIQEAVAAVAEKALWRLAVMVGQEL